MTVKGVLKSCGKALLYFAIYFGWQIIVINWVAFAYSLYLTSTMDLSERVSLSYDQMVQVINDRVNDIILRYSMELTLIAGILTLLTFFLIFKARKKKPLAEVGITKLSPSKLPVLFALGVSLNVFVTMAMAMIPFPQQWVDSYIESSAPLTGMGLVTILTTVIAAPLVEEVTFRGLIYGRLKQGMPMFAAMLLTSWVFGMMHGQIIWVIYASLLGILLTWVYEKYRSLTASIVVHFAFNLMGMLSELLGEISDLTFYLLLLASAVASVALISYISNTSKHEIEFSFKARGEDGHDR